MTLKPSILCTFLFFSFFLFSFRNIDMSPAKEGLKSSYNEQKEIRLDTGRIVNLDSIQSCLTNYTKLMKDHGFSNPGGPALHTNDLPQRLN